MQLAPVMISNRILIPLLSLTAGCEALDGPTVEFVATPKRDVYVTKSPLSPGYYFDFTGPQFGEVIEASARCGEPNIVNPPVPHKVWTVGAINNAMSMWTMTQNTDSYGWRKYEGTFQYAAGDPTELQIQLQAGKCYPLRPAFHWTIDGRPVSMELDVKVEVCGDRTTTSTCAEVSAALQTGVHFTCYRRTHNDDGTMTDVPAGCPPGMTVGQKTTTAIKRRGQPATVVETGPGLEP